MKTFRTLSAVLLALGLSVVLPGCAAAPAALTPAPPATAQPTPPASTPATTPASTTTPGLRPTPALALAPTPAGTPAGEEERITLTFRAAPVEQVFDMLSRKDNVNILLSKGVTGAVTLNLYDVTVKEAIYAVARAAGYWVEAHDGGYTIIVGSAAGVDNPASNNRVQTLKVQYSDTLQVADILSKYVSRYGKVTPLLGRKMIVVEDLPAFVERVEKLLGQLDVPPKQIMIEAKILEVTLDESERFGVDWKQVFGTPGGDTTGSFGTTGLAGGTLAAPPQGFFFSLLDKRLELFLGALASKGRVRTLSTPKLLALENQEAKVIIGDSTGYKVTTTINQVTTESIQFLESGIILKVTPSVDQRGRVVLKVQPEVSSASLAAGVPSKKSTQVTTELISGDGQSIFIAGLIKSKGSLDRSGVPILGDLPVIGNLFSTAIEAVSTSETVVIITPHIVREPGDADRFSEDRARQAEQAAASIAEQEARLRRGKPPPP